MKAIIVADIDDGDGLKPGAIEMRTRYADSGVAGFAFRCPCGCGREGWLPIRAAGAGRTQTPEWEWDGDREAPTLFPSVFNSGMPCRWHGWLHAGVWKSC